MENIINSTYKNLKSEYNNYIIWFIVDKYVECFNECAEKTSNLLKLKLHKINNRLQSGFIKKDLEKNLNKIVVKNKCNVLVYCINSHKLIKVETK